MSKDYKICPVCFGNGEVRKEEPNPLEVNIESLKVVVELQETIRLLREDGEELIRILNALKGYTGENGLYSFCAKETGTKLGTGDALILGQLFDDGDKAINQHNALIKQLDEQEMGKQEKHYTLQEVKEKFFPNITLDELEGKGEQDWMTTAKKVAEENKDVWEHLAKE